MRLGQLLAQARDPEPFRVLLAMATGHDDITFYRGTWQYRIEVELPTATGVQRLMVPFGDDYFDHGSDCVIVFEQAGRYWAHGDIRGTIPP